MVSYYEHNKRERGEMICQRIQNGEDCAIVTDAGMPAISAPGRGSCFTFAMSLEFRLFPFPDLPPLQLHLPFQEWKQADLPLRDF